MIARVERFVEPALLLALALSPAATLLGSPDETPFRPVDYGEIPRRIAKEPEYVGPPPPGPGKGT